MKTLVYISWGHLGAHGREPAKGAESPFAPRWEVIEVGKYIQSLMATCLKAGFHVIIDGEGGLDERQRKACQYAHDFDKVAYVSCHLNALPGEDPKQKAVFFHDARSQGGRALAHCIKDRVARTFVIESMPVAVRETHTFDWTVNAHACVAGIYAGPANISAVLCEPFAMNATPKINNADLRLMGRTIAAGIVDWTRVT